MKRVRHVPTQRTDLPPTAGDAGAEASRGVTHAGASRRMLVPRSGYLITAGMRTSPGAQAGQHRARWLAHGQCCAGSPTPDLAATWATGPMRNWPHIAGSGRNRATFGARDDDLYAIVWSLRRHRRRQHYFAILLRLLMV